MELRTVHVLELLVRTYVFFKHSACVFYCTLRLLEKMLSAVLRMLEGPLLVWTEHPYDIFVRPLYKLLVFAVTSAYYPYCTTVGNVVLSPVMEEAVALFVEENVNSSFPRRLVNGRTYLEDSEPCWSSSPREAVVRICVKSTLRLRRRAKLYVRTRLQELCTFFTVLEGSV